MRTTDVELWVVVDAQGDTGQGTDAASAIENYTDNVGALEDSNGFRVVTVTVTIPITEVATISLTASAPALADAKGRVS